MSRVTHDCPREEFRFSRGAKNCIPPASIFQAVERASPPQSPTSLPIRQSFHSLGHDQHGGATGEKDGRWPRAEVPCFSGFGTLSTEALRYNGQGTAMTSGRSGTELAVLAMVCVLTIFLFPAIHGPYSAVHGPASSLQAARAGARLRATIVDSARKSLRKFPLPLLAFFRTGTQDGERGSFNLPECDSILRC